MVQPVVEAEGGEVDLAGEAAGGGEAGVGAGEGERQKKRRSVEKFNCSQCLLLQFSLLSGSL